LPLKPPVEKDEGSAMNVDKPESDVEKVKLESTQTPVCQPLFIAIMLNELLRNHVRAVAHP